MQSLESISAVFHPSHVTSCSRASMWSLFSFVSAPTPLGISSNNGQNSGSAQNLPTKAAQPGPDDRLSGCCVRLIARVCLLRLCGNISPI